jgi:hypothetical protein
VGVEEPERREAAGVVFGLGEVAIAPVFECSMRHIGVLFVSRDPASGGWRRTEDPIARRTESTGFSIKVPGSSVRWESCPGLIH